MTFSTPAAIAALTPAARLITLTGFPDARLAGFFDAAARLAGLDDAARLAGLDDAARLAGLDDAARLAGLDPSPPR